MSKPTRDDLYQRLIDQEEYADWSSKPPAQAVAIQESADRFARVFDAFAKKHAPAAADKKPRDTQ